MKDRHKKIEREENFRGLEIIWKYRNIYLAVAFTVD